MHQDLSSHLHTPECNRLIAELHKCHEENPFRKFLGGCNKFYADVNRCLREEREAKRYRNRTEKQKPAQVTN